MARLAWSDECRVGVDQIDDEHQGLFDAIAELESAATRNSNPESVGALLSTLAHATRAHFSGEEAMMRAAKYPGLALHLANHQRLLEKLEAFVARYDRSGHAMNEHAVNFLRDWFFHHIQNDDRRFGDWLKERKSS